MQGIKKEAKEEEEERHFLPLEKKRGRRRGDNIREESSLDLRFNRAIRT